MNPPREGKKLLVLDIDYSGFRGGGELIQLLWILSLCWPDRCRLPSALVLDCMISSDCGWGVRVLI